MASSTWKSLPTWYANSSLPYANGDAKMAKASSKSTSKTDKGIAIDIGISAKDREAVAHELSKMLADSYTLYLTTHNFHWNVTGPLFNTLHDMFMTQYTEQWQALDEIAERIRALGHYAPGTYAQYGKLASITAPTDVPEANDMVRFLVKGN